MWWKEKPYIRLIGMSVSPTTIENNMESSQKIKNRSTIGSSNSTSKGAPKGNKNKISLRYSHTPVYHSTSQDMEAPQMPINDEWMKEM